MRVTERNADAERRAAVRLAFDGDSTAMQLHQFLHQCQPDAAALVTAAFCPFDAIEALEQPAQRLGRDSAAGVTHAEDGRVPSRTECNGDLALERELEGVGEQV